MADFKCSGGSRCARLVRPDSQVHAVEPTTTGIDVHYTTSIHNPANLSLGVLIQTTHTESVRVTEEEPLNPVGTFSRFFW